MLIRDVLKVNKESINPQKHKDVLFCHYSLPAFDNNKTPEIQLGEEILSSKFKLTKPCILFNKLNVRFKRIWNLASVNKNYICSSEYLPLSVFNQDYIQDYMYYLLLSDMVNSKLLPDTNGTSSSHQRIDPNTLLNIEIKPISIDKQQHIVNILGTIDDKIENNEKIISNLLHLANTNYLSFVSKNSLQLKRIDEIFDITIGRTPPRKESEWFTTNPNGMKWISIADMGKCEGYIFDTSENLTIDAVNRFNVPIVPTNTVILSFKLTVGRIAITTENMVSNEAIAHFKTQNNKLVPYLYLFLKNYDFNKLGSTSSIATATNSKAVKSINFSLPDVAQINGFYELINPIFNKIKHLQYTNRKLNETKNLYLKKFFG